MRNCRRRPHDAPTFTLPSRLALQAQANDEYVRFAMQDNDGTKPEHLSSWFKTKFDDLQLRYYVGPRCANYHQLDNWPGTVRYRWNNQCTACAMLLPPAFHASIVLFTFFTACDILLGERAELMEHAVYMLLTVLTFAYAARLVPARKPRRPRGAAWSTATARGSNVPAREATWIHKRRRLVWPA